MPTASPIQEYRRRVADAEYNIDRKTHRVNGFAIGALGGAAGGAGIGYLIGRRVNPKTAGLAGVLGTGIGTMVGSHVGQAIGERRVKAKADKPDKDTRALYRVVGGVNSNFSIPTMPTSLNTHAAIKLTRLAAKARAITTELAANPAYPEEKRPSTIGKIAKTAAIAGGLGALGYGVGSYLRGRKILTSGNPLAVVKDGKIVSPLSTLAGNVAAFKAGHAANLADAGNFARLAGAKINAGGRAALSKSEELKRRLAASLAGARNAAARGMATTPIQPTYSVD